MKTMQRPWSGCNILFALTTCIFSAQTSANDSDATLIMMGDLHGTLVPHAAVLKNDDGTAEVEVSSAGGAGQAQDRGGRHPVRHR